MECSALISGAGATTACENVEECWLLIGMVSGTGATTVLTSPGDRRLADAIVEASGTAGCTGDCDQATMFGSGRS